MENGTQTEPHWPEPGIFILQNITAWYRVLPGPQRNRYHCAGARVRAHWNLPVYLMLPCPILGLNYLIFPCSILNRISRTSRTPPPPCTSKIVTGLLPGNPLILQTWSRAGKDLTHSVVRFDVLPQGLQFRASGLPTPCWTPPPPSMPLNWCWAVQSSNLLQEGSQCRGQGEGGRESRGGVGRWI